mmetsp:Transcript_6443/g.11195  ORF Transcript_6443/g.11195 Transcript_6443/m.11195 type:complete len:271 (-) Transcript_6443:164-976(-)
MGDDAAAAVAEAASAATRERAADDDAALAEKEARALRGDADATVRPKTGSAAPRETQQGTQELQRPASQGATQRRRQDTTSLTRAPPNQRSWSDLEKMKGRLATAMDRVEFLATARNRLTDLRAQEGRDMTFMMRYKSNPNSHLGEAVRAATPNVVHMFEDHRQQMKGSQTAWKRLEQLNQYVYLSEERQGGPEGLSAAKRSAREGRPESEWYPDYHELCDYKAKSLAATHWPPVLAVGLNMPYCPAKEITNKRGWKPPSRKGSERAQTA